MSDPLGGLGRIPAGVAPQRELNGLAAATPSSDSALSDPGRINFRDVLMNSLEQVNQFDKQAQASIATSLTGNDLTQAEVFTAVKKADGQGSPSLGPHAGTEAGAPRRLATSATFALIHC